MESVPADYKVVTPFIKRAHEVRQADKPLQYWCLMHAAQLAMTTKTEDESTKTWLYSLVDKLEALKEELGDNQVVTDMVAGQAYVENLALKIFTGADTEDRAGKASQGTVKKFLAAADFLDLLTEFGTLEPDIQEKLTYAKWKATDIARALREGRKPHAGPIAQPETDEFSISAVGDALGAPLASPSRSMADAQGMNVDTPIESHTLAGGPSEYGAPGAERPAGLPEYPFPASQAPSAPQAPSDPQAPAPAPSAPQAFAALPPPPPPQPQSTVPPPPPAPVQSYQTPAHIPVAQHAPAQQHVSLPPPRTNIDPKEVGKAQKHAKWAISALDYDDYPTARKELLAALAILGG